MASLASCATAGISALCTLHSLSPYYSSQTHTHTQNVTTKLKANNSPPPLPPSCSLSPANKIVFFHCSIFFTNKYYALGRRTYNTMLSHTADSTRWSHQQATLSFIKLHTSSSPPSPTSLSRHLNKLLQALNIFPL